MLNASKRHYVFTNNAISSAREDRLRRGQRSDTWDRVTIWSTEFELGLWCGIGTHVAQVDEEAGAISAGNKHTVRVGAE